MREKEKEKREKEREIIEHEKKREGAYLCMNHHPQEILMFKQTKQKININMSFL